MGAGDAVLGAPEQAGLVALQPHRRFRPVDPGAKERRDRRGVARAGEVQQRRLGRGAGAVFLLALALAAAPDDLAVLVALEVDLANSVGEGTGGELLDQVLVVAAQALEYVFEGAVAGGGDYVRRVLAGLKEHRHNDPGGLGAAVAVGPQRATDVLHDLDLRAAGIGEADRFHAPLTGDIHAFAEDAAAREERPVHTLAPTVDAVRELPQRLAAFGDEMVPAQPLRPHPVRGHVPAGVQLVEPGAD